MKKVIDYVREDLSAFEPIDIKIRVDDYVMKASPTDSGRWNITLKNNSSVEGQYLMSREQTEELASKLLSGCYARRFVVRLERDADGYCIGHAYKAKKMSMKDLREYLKN